jgi:putative oxidoreductase
LLALLGAVGGVALAVASVRVLLALIPVQLPFWMRIEVDAPVLLFSLAVAALTSLLFGLTPALMASRVNLNDAFRDGTKGSSGGAKKLFGAFGGPGLSAIVQMMGPLGYLVTIGEFFGGLGLIFGFLSRFSAASIILIMLGAIGMVHSQFGFFMNWTGKQAGEGFEYHLLVIGTLLPILIAGPGRFAIGRYLPLPKIARADRVVTVLE